MKKHLIKIISMLLVLTTVFSALMSVTSFGTFLSGFDYIRKAKSFTDVTSEDWFCSNVTAAYRVGIIDGDDTGTFRPEDTLSYAEAIKIAAVFYDIYQNGTVTLSVGSGSKWYQPYVNYAYENGIISSKIIRNINSGAKRSDVAQMFYNAMCGTDNLEQINVISDGDIPDVAQDSSYGEAVYSLYRAGILCGSDENLTFNPSNTITRAEIAAIVNRMFDSTMRIKLNMAINVGIYFPRLSLTGSTVQYVDTEFEYDDSYFLGKSYELSGDLARVAMSLSAGVYLEDSIGETFTEMGADILELNYETDDDNDDTCAYVIAHKQAVLNGSTKNIYFVVLRGTNSENTNEWKSNLNIGSVEGADHVAFTNAAKLVLSKIKAQISTAKDSNVILITGHSRGGAVSALLTEMITDEGKLAPTDSIYGYSFAAPAYTTDEGYYKNLFVFNNPGDVIIGSPFVSWGYTTGGTMTYLATDSATMSKLDSYLQKYTGSTYGGLTDNSSYTELLADWCTTKKEYYTATSSGGMSPYEMIYTILGFELSTDYLVSVMKIVFTYKITENDKKIMLTLAKDLVPMYRSHCPETYLAWINAMYAD